MVKALALLLFTLGLFLSLISGSILFVAFADWRARGCPGLETCADPVGVMVLAGCALIAALLMMAAGVVFVRR